MDDAVWTPTTFTKNRERLLDGDIARAFFEDVVAQARGRRLLSDEHFTVDGTLLEAWAGQKSFRRKDQPPPPPDDPGNPTVNFHGERRSNHDAPVDDRSRQPAVQEGQGPRGEAGVSRRSADGESARPGRRCVRGAGDRHRRTRRGAEPGGGPAAATRCTVGGDKGYDTRGFVDDAARAGGHAAHRAEGEAVARSTGARRAIAGYAVSQRVRKRIEEVFGWMKTVGGMRKLQHRGGERVNWQFLFTAAAYNLVRMRTLMATA